MTFREALEYLEGLNRFGMKLGLSRIERLLEWMEYPQKCYKTVHITGTNGKGSTTALLAEMLRSAGIRTGMYTSPHLESYTERLRLDGAPCTEEAFARAISEARTFADRMDAAGEEYPTQFEVLTAAAFWYFAQEKVEYAVIEVGLGGLLDSTNVIVPEVSVITNIALDHAERCGGTLAGIAAHKAGIIKDGVPLVTAAVGEPRGIVLRAAAEKAAPVLCARRDFCGEFAGFNGTSQTLAFRRLPDGEPERFALSLLGRHQIENGALAVMTALVLGETQPRITRAAIAEGLRSAVWGGRFEILRGSDAAIVVDGAHNPAGVAVLRENLDFYFPEEKRVFLLGILQDKDVEAMVRLLIRPDDVVVTAEPDSARAASSGYVAQRIRGARVETAASIARGLGAAREIARHEGRLLCAAGSLYLIGEARRLLLAELGEGNG